MTKGISKVRSQRQDSDDKVQEIKKNKVRGKRYFYLALKLKNLNK